MSKVQPRDQNDTKKRLSLLSAIKRSTKDNLGDNLTKNGEDGPVGHTKVFCIKVTCFLISSGIGVFTSWMSSKALHSLNDSWTLGTLFASFAILNFGFGLIVGFSVLRAILASLLPTGLGFLLATLLSRFDGGREHKISDGFGLFCTHSWRIFLPLSVMFLLNVSLNYYFARSVHKLSPRIYLMRAGENCVGFTVVSATGYIAYYPLLTQTVYSSLAVTFLFPLYTSLGLRLYLGDHLSFASLALAVTRNNMSRPWDYSCFVYLRTHFFSLGKMAATVPSVLALLSVKEQATFGIGVTTSAAFEFVSQMLQVFFWLKSSTPDRDVVISSGAHPIFEASRKIKYQESFSRMAVSFCLYVEDRVEKNGIVACVACLLYLIQDDKERMLQVLFRGAILLAVESVTDFIKCKVVENWYGIKRPTRLKTHYLELIPLFASIGISLSTCLYIRYVMVILNIEPLF